MGAIDYVTKPVSPPILLARPQGASGAQCQCPAAEKPVEQLSRYLARRCTQSLFDGSRQAEITQRRN